jgi:hypothetical protein
MTKALVMEIHQRWQSKRSTFALGLSKGGK